MNIFKLGERVIEPATRSIRVGDQVSRLRPICWDVLMYLVDHRGEIVAMDTLMETVWRGQIGEHAYVRKAIHEIRTALEDRERQIIKTLPRAGYVIETDAIEEADSTEETPNLQTPSAGEKLVYPRLSSDTYSRISHRLRRKRRDTTS